MGIPVSLAQPLSSLPRVAILLCSYNGERFLAEQLDSLKGQSYGNWEVWVSDDGSTDNTLDILQQYQSDWGLRLRIVRGPARGFASNFLSLVCRTEIEADYFSYADQDDIWDRHKIQRAIARLEALKTSKPALYCSRTCLIDERGAVLGFSRLFTQKPDFRNALVQNIGGGNTMVFNRAVRNLLISAGPDLDVAAHDWWTYIAVTATGGAVIYDPEPSLLYRQHENNLMGSNKGVVASMRRALQLMQGEMRRWNDANVTGIECLVASLPPLHGKVFEQFKRSRGAGIANRLISLKRSGVYRQTWMGNLGLFVAAFFRKL
jgi:glycosyltransferase involved in cell wall biosynthesis